jgi:hypothetical protein
MTQAAAQPEMLGAVQRYQRARMRVTHANLLRSPLYRPLCEFFLEDLYGSPDIAARAAALSSLTDLVKPVLGHWMYEGAHGLVELQSLSDGLDARIKYSWRGVQGETLTWA